MTFHLKIKTLEWVLRIAISGVFLGHGVFALEVSPSFIPFLVAYGFSESTAAILLPYIGTIDLFVACMTLIKPIRIILIWATFWAFATALARPLSGQPIWSFIERAPNWLSPLSLLILQGVPKKIRDIFSVRSDV